MVKSDNPASTYLSHIDGLRAVAVVPVVLFHAGLGAPRGGFVGVDVFFVISGYLITSIIWREIQASRFSILRFYERRVRRIFPALAAILIFVLAVSSVLFLPIDLREMPKRVLATLCFVSNILFYTQADYFHAPSRFNPLLHTWSLAVEEQYYLIFPILMATLFRLRRSSVGPALAGIGLLSFALSAWGALNAPTFSFFMAPTRIWELFAGSMLALGWAPALRAGIAREAAASAGLCMIFAAVFLYSDDTPFPGLAALLPVLGSVLVIEYGRSTRSGSFLTWKPIVAIGLVSYSLYLWHWPLIVFSEYASSAPLSGPRSLAVIFVSVVAAFLSWQFIERPFRVRRGEPRHVRPRHLFGYSVATGAAIACLSTIVWAGNGWPGRFSPESLRLEAFAKSVNPRRNECNRRLGECSYGASVTPTVALWGDSHGNELVYALGRLAAEDQLAIRQFTFGGCAPAIAPFDGKTKACNQFNAGALRVITGDPSLKDVILVANLDNARYRSDKSFYVSYGKLIGVLMQARKRITIVYPIPTLLAPAPRVLALLANRAKPMRFSVPLSEYLTRNREMLAFLDRVGGDRVTRVRPFLVLCASGSCETLAGKAILYSDDNHLSNEGAQHVMPLFRPLLSRIACPALTRSSAAAATAVPRC